MIDDPPGGLLQSLVADPRGLYWAGHCGFVPGAGFCQRERRGDCAKCPFTATRDADACAVRRRRQRRRLRRG